MANGNYAGSGKALDGDTPLGHADLCLRGLHTDRGREAKGAIVFSRSAGPALIGRHLKFVPDDGHEAFDVVVTGIYYGCVAVASCGTMPWWR